jgi:hypothetical protein
MVSDNSATSSHHQRKAWGSRRIAKLHILPEVVQRLIRSHPDSFSSAWPAAYRFDRDNLNDRAIPLGDNDLFSK